MNFPFSYDIDVGGVVVATISGAGLIGASPTGAWQLEGLLIEGSRDDAWGRVAVTMRRDHPLYAPIAAALLAQSRDDIEEAWRLSRARVPARLLTKADLLPEHA